MLSIYINVVINGVFFAIIAVQRAVYLRTCNFSHWS